MNCLCVACAMGSWADTWLGRERLGVGWGRVGLLMVGCAGLGFVREGRRLVGVGAGATICLFVVLSRGCTE